MAQAGEEWSTPWGNAHMQWYGSILPRIRAFVPTDTCDANVVPTGEQPMAAPLSSYGADKRARASRRLGSPGADGWIALFNLYGPRQTPTRYIRALSRAFCSKTLIQEHYSGQS